MIFKGELCLRPKNDNYTVFSDGKLADLSEELNLLLLEKVHIVLKRAIGEDEIFNLQGKLEKKKTAPCYYQYYVGKTNIDEILWSLVGRKIKIEIHNISTN